MPACLQCGDHFPNTIKIDGKRKSLRNRTRCLTCSPYKAEKKTSAERKASNAKKFRDWYHRKKEQGIDPVNDRKIAQRQFIINLTDGCQFCGYNRVLRNITFHHLNDKDFSLSSRIFSRSLESLLPEIMKCVVCCHNCHGEIHEGHICVEKVQEQHVKFVAALAHLEAKNWQEAMNRTSRS